MTYVIAQPCVDLKDRACVDECPVKAIFPQDDLPHEWNKYIQLNLDYYKAKS